MNGQTTVQAEFDRKQIDYKRAKTKWPITATGPFIGASLYQLQYGKSEPKFFKSKHLMIS